MGILVGIIRAPGTTDSWAKRPGVGPFLMNHLPIPGKFKAGAGFGSQTQPQDRRLRAGPSPCPLELPDLKEAFLRNSHVFNFHPPPHREPGSFYRQEHQGPEWLSHLPKSTQPAHFMSWAHFFLVRSFFFFFFFFGLIDLEEVFKYQEKCLFIHAMSSKYFLPVCGLPFDFA